MKVIVSSILGLHFISFHPGLQTDKLYIITAFVSELESTLAFAAKCVCVWLCVDILTYDQHKGLHVTKTALSGRTQIIMGSLSMELTCQSLTF